MRPDHADAAPEDLVRARVPADVVRVARAVDKHRHAVRARRGTSGGHASAGRPRDDVAGAQLASPRRPPLRGQSSSVAVPSRMTKTSSSAEWQCGTHPRWPPSSFCQCRPATRRALAGREGRLGPVSLVHLVLDLVDVDDVRGPRRRLADRERLDGRLDVPRIVVASLDPRPAEPDRARARQPADLRRVARAEDEVLEPVGPGDERVLHLVRPVDDAVERPHLVHVAVLPREARAGEDEVELLGGAVRVGRSRQLARRDADAVHADRDAFPPRCRAACQVASISPLARWCASTSSQCATPMAAQCVRTSGPSSPPAPRRGRRPSRRPRTRPRRSRPSRTPVVRARGR